jgi:hypothetical protein
MRILICISLVGAALGPAYATDAGETASETNEETDDPGYVVREEKVINFGTGKVEYEKVIEFPELEILPELSRPVEIIIPRTKPNFDQMPFTIYNNEPSTYLPEEYRLRYYRRVPADDSLGEVKTGDMFKAPDAENGGEEDGG